MATVLEELFREQGPVNELLCDNSATFRSYKLVELCRQWNIRQRFRAAYRPSGNGIVKTETYSACFAEMIAAAYRSLREEWAFFNVVC